MATCLLVGTKLVWSYADMAADMAALMDALGLAHSPVVGLSDGEVIGLILAEQRPDLVSKLLATGASFNPSGLGDFLNVVRSSTRQQLLAGAPPQLQRFVEIQRKVSPDRGAVLVSSAEKMQRMWLDFDIPKATLGRFKAPTIIAASDREDIPIEHTIELWRAIPAQLMIVPARLTSGSCTRQGARRTCLPIFSDFGPSTHVGGRPQP